MPAILTDQHVCSMSVPLAWRELLLDLEKFLDTERVLHDQQVQISSEQMPPAILALHSRLVHRSAALLEPEALADQSFRDDARLFARATLMLMRLNECVAAGPDQRLDTAGSLTLGDFRADFEASTDSLRRLRRALWELPELTSAELSTIEAEVEKDVLDAQRKRRVVAALREEFHLREGAPELRQNIWNLFTTCYPDTGIRPDELEIIVTGCMIFFCIPFSGRELQTDRFRRASPQEQAVTRRFLDRVGKFSHWQFAHFPVFGFLKGENLPEPLLHRLSTATGLTMRETALEISHLTAIVPLAEVDKYVPHDVWGHSWQASMLHYDDLYDELSTYDAPLSLTDTTKIKDGQSMQLGDCFPIVNGRAKLSKSQFRTFAEAFAVQRLPVAMTPVLAELIADIAEFKFLDLEPHRAHELPNSSLLQSFPSKLDLMLEDVMLYFRQATKALRLWSDQPSRQRQTIQQLAERGATVSSASEVVTQAAAIWHELEAGPFEPRLRWSKRGTELQVNVITRVMLNFLGIHRASIETYLRINQLHVGNLPLRSFRDLLLLSAAIYFEADPPRNLWRVDEFVSLRVVPWFQRLAGTLDT